MNPRGNPATLKKFRKGQSGNPGGRPKASVEFRTRCRDFMDEKGWTHLVELACRKGQYQIHALKFIAEQGFGKAPQPITGKDGEPIRLDGAIIADGTQDQYIAALREMRVPAEAHGNGDRR